VVAIQACQQYAAAFSSPHQGPPLVFALTDRSRPMLNNQEIWIGSRSGINRSAQDGATN
jgi:hypothetical protein